VSVSPWEVSQIEKLITKVPFILMVLRLKLGQWKQRVQWVVWVIARSDASAGIHRQKCFPYRCGSIQKGESAGSDLKRFFDFILSNVLRNTFKIFEFLTKTDEGNHKVSFSSHCILLAEELFDSIQK